MIESPVTIVGDGCITVIKTEQNTNGGETIILHNKCPTNSSANVTIGITEDNNASMNISVEAGSNRSVYVTDRFVITAYQAVVVSAYYDPVRKELVFRANGTGTQEVLIYVDGMGKPYIIGFSPGTMGPWTYDPATQVVTATVTYGSPHDMTVSWYVPPSSPSTGGSSTSSSSSGGCTYNWTCTEWSECTSDATMTRNCTNMGTCPGTYGKPEETKACTYVPPAATCTEDWSCTEWGECVDSTQSRTCTDLNECGTMLSKPPVTQSCEAVQDTADDGLTGLITGGVAVWYAGLAVLLIALIGSSVYYFRKK